MPKCGFFSTTISWSFVRDEKKTNKAHSGRKKCWVICWVLRIFGSENGNELFFSANKWLCLRNVGDRKYFVVLSQDSPVGIATGCGLDDRGLISGRGNTFFLTPQRPGPTQPLIQWIPGSLSPGVKRPRRKADNSLLFSAEVKNRGTILPRHHTSSWRGA
jgi:hypothetical protein